MCQGAFFLPSQVFGLLSFGVASGGEEGGFCSLELLADFGLTLGKTSAGLASSPDGVKLMIRPRVEAASEPSRVCSQRAAMWG